MLNKFLSGLVFGAGFSIAFLVVTNLYYELYVDWRYPMLDELEYGALDGVPEVEPDDLVRSAPDLARLQQRFLGSSGIYASGFEDIGDKVLAAGPGAIEGAVTRGGEPAPGVKLRLALNGAVMSEWVVTGADGRYSIPVPYGDYQVGGYELDHKAANKALTGLINDPANNHRTATFQVAEDSPAQGISLNYVKPVVKLSRRESFSSPDEARFAWQPYPGAQDYRIQVWEKSDPNDWRGRALFDWGELPRVESTEFSLAPYKDRLEEEGRYYLFEVEAMGEGHYPMSETGSRRSDYDFSIGI